MKKVANSWSHRLRERLSRSVIILEDRTSYVVHFHSDFFMLTLSDICVGNYNFLEYDKKH